MAARAYDADSTFGERVHIVHIYVIEPHPKAPDISPYSAIVWESDYSTERQPMSYPERVAKAKLVRPFIEGRQTQLVDELSPRSDNPVWCTYGPCPKCGFLIGQDGVIDTVMHWADPVAMEARIRGLFGDQ